MDDPEGLEDRFRNRDAGGCRVGSVLEAPRSSFAHRTLRSDGRGDRDENKAIFDELNSHREAIESAFGGKLDWQRLDAKRGCRIRGSIVEGGWRDEER